MHPDFKVNESFSEFVKKNLNISPSFALKLWTIDEILSRYKKLEYLSISFDEYDGRKDEILFLMRSHPGFASMRQDINDDFDLDDMDLNEWISIFLN